MPDKEAADAAEKIMAILGPLNSIDATDALMAVCLIFQAHVIREIMEKLKT